MDKNRKNLMVYLDTAEERFLEGMIIRSPYVGILQESRQMTNRDIAYGMKKDGQSHGSWLGAIGYMIVLDHIGDRFISLGKGDALTSMRQDYGGEINSFMKALLYFSELTNQEIFTLYALRCSFVHESSLSNIGRPILTYHFSVCQGADTPLIVYPEEQWNGIMTERSRENTTLINLELFADLVESIHFKLINLSQADKLELCPNAKLDYITYKK